MADPVRDVQSPPPGPVVMITGGLSGIGSSTALEFASLGARLMLCDRSTASGDDVVTRVRAAGGEALVNAVDVRDPAALQAAADDAVEAFGPIDVLVACAGISDQSSIAMGDPEYWRTVIETNLTGTIFAARSVVSGMTDRGYGHIFVVSSVSGRDSYAGEPVYIASKWGQIGFAHSLRLELMDAGVRVSLVEPGLVDTPLTRDNPVIRPLLDAVEPLGPQDVAKAIVYAYRQPPHVVVSEIVLRPLKQKVPERPYNSLT